MASTAFSVPCSVQVSKESLEAQKKMRDAKMKEQLRAIEMSDVNADDGIYVYAYVYFQKYVILFITCALIFMHTTIPTIK